jgi:hypothetical protein
VTSAIDAWNSVSDAIMRQPGGDDDETDGVRRRKIRAEGSTPMRRTRMWSFDGTFIG